MAKYVYKKTLLKKNINPYTKNNNELVPRNSNWTHNLNKFIEIEKKRNLKEYLLKWKL